MLMPVMNVFELSKWPSVTSGAQYVCNPGLEPFTALWLLYASPNLTRENSTFSPQIVFMRFV